MQFRSRFITLGFIFIVGFVGVCGYFANFGMLTRTKYSMSESIRRDITQHMITDKRAVAVTGVGELEEDEFLLSLLHEQNLWSGIILGTKNVPATKKRFISRSARYSGLLNVLNIVPLDMNNDIELSNYLSGVEAWLAFNITLSSIANYTNTAIKAGVKRVIFTMQLSDDSSTCIDMNQTAAAMTAEFDLARKKIQASGGAFTGISHGKIIPGSEDHPYNIRKLIPGSEEDSFYSASRSDSMDATVSGTLYTTGTTTTGTTPATIDTIRNGVLARISTELLRNNETYHQLCTISTADAYANAYLNILRSSGLTRQEEVMKIFQGRIYQVKELTNKAHEEKKKLKEESLLKERIRKGKEEAMAEGFPVSTAAGGRSDSKTSSSRAASRALADDDIAIDFDDTTAEEEAEEEQELGYHLYSNINNNNHNAHDPNHMDKYTVKQEETWRNMRAEEILQNIWARLNARFYAKTTSKTQFFEDNMELALNLAKNEQQQHLKYNHEQLLSAHNETDNRNKEQYMRLINLEKKELRNQQIQSEHYIRAAEQNVILSSVLDELYVYCQLAAPIYYNNNNNIPVYSNIEEIAEIVKCLYKIDPTVLCIHHAIPPIDTVTEGLYRNYRHYLHSNKSLQDSVAKAVATLSASPPTSALASTSGNTMPVGGGHLGYSSFTGSGSRDQINEREDFIVT